MTVREAARALEVSESLIYKLCARGRLGHHRVGLGRGAIRIDAEDVAAYKRARAVEGTPEPGRAPAAVSGGAKVVVPDRLGAYRAAKEARRAGRSAG